jgi:AcrR family transcriptional regulator
VISAVADPDISGRGADQTRFRILVATRELYVNRGSKGTTTREVAVRAGVNEATLFRHFGTKKQLIDAMLEHFSQLDSPWRSLEDVEALPTLESQLTSLGAIAIESMLRKQDIMRMAMAEEVTNPQGDSCAWRASNEARKVLVDFFERKTAAGQMRGEPEFLACSFMSHFYAYIMAKKIWGPYDRPVDRVVKNIVELFLNGARA